MLGNALGTVCGTGSGPGHGFDHGLYVAHSSNISNGLTDNIIAEVLITAVDVKMHFDV
jgi:hypothetical protein